MITMNGLRNGIWFAVAFGIRFAHIWQIRSVALRPSECAGRVQLIEVGLTARAPATVPEPCNAALDDFGFDQLQEGSPVRLRFYRDDPRTFEQMVVSNAEIAVRLIKKLARRLDSADELIEVLMHRDPRARVILGLSREAQFLGQKREDGSVLVPLTSDELAEQVGLSPRETQEVLKRLSRLKIVQLTGGGLVRYSVQAHTRAVDADGYIEIAGLSGLNPNGRHHIILPRR